MYHYAFHDHLNEQNADIQFTKKMEEEENFLSRLFGEPTTNYERQYIENRCIPTDYSTNNPAAARLHTKPRL